MAISPNQGHLPAEYLAAEYLAAEYWAVGL